MWVLERTREKDTRRENAHNTHMQQYTAFVGLRYTLCARGGAGKRRASGEETTRAAEGVEPAARSVKSAMQLNRLRSSDTNASHDSTHLLKPT